jgi:hypothetical protein
LKRILIAAALCLVSFQSYAESEMTFHQFNDFYYSSLSLNGDDKSQYFLRYANTTVKEGTRVGDPINYSAGKYGDANGFRDACLAKCVGEEKCGGVVFHYYKTDKKTPKKCVLKTLEPTTKTNKQKKKDFYRRVCYGGGPGGYPMPDDGSDNETACELFGKTIVKTASGTIVAPTTCNDGDPYTKANDQACYAAGKTACWDSNVEDSRGHNPWVVGTVGTNVLGASDNPIYDFCWRFCAASDACYGDKPYVLADFPVGHICKQVEGSSEFWRGEEWYGGRGLKGAYAILCDSQ